MAPALIEAEKSGSSLTKHSNPSLQVTASRGIEMVEAPMEKPGHGDVLLHIKTTGICGSDVHFWKRGAIGSLKVEGNCILGHEAAGIVLEVGEGVTTVRKGDRVAVEPQVPCGICFSCTSGRTNLCPQVRFIGVYPHHGALQRFKVHPARYVHKLPENVSYAQGALLEPLSVVLHGLSHVKLSIGRGAMICGAGPIGLIALAAARASGAHPLVITDLEPKRLAFAKEFVPSCEVYQVDTTLDAESNAVAIRALFGPTEYEAPATILECTGAESSVVTAAHVVRTGGDLLVIGVGKDIMNNLPFMKISLSEINLKFINRYTDTWPAAISAFSGGILNLDKLITHTFALENAMDALKLCSDVTQGSIKIQVVDERDID
ncbi:GroES-like protein [Hyaloscypha variabilis F]|uniref:GroES-like protein n=1 Tax=Hyaloscypha variabilis (strain UAMH 11265 / GT02V1 / F) TaxID=1149755 RepID=A0A2J6RDA5_HYAVF|nr:GroES-like protein [Hyaloscypha variabilis F]